MSELIDGMTPDEAKDYQLFKSVQSYTGRLSYQQFERDILPLARRLRTMNDWTDEDSDRADAVNEAGRD